MLLDILIICTIPAAMFALYLLPWSDASIEETHNASISLIQRIRAWLHR